MIAKKKGHENSAAKTRERKTDWDNIQRIKVEIEGTVIEQVSDFIVSRKHDFRS